jgi:hypothetical protein
LRLGIRTALEAFMIILVEEGRLLERLVPATPREFDALKAQMKIDSRLMKQLDSPLDEIPQYKYLYQQDFVGGYGLFDLLNYITNTEKKATVLFSKAGNKFTGFIAYVDDGKTISKIKMASFFDDEKKSALVMARDLREFLTKEIQDHKLITWEAYFINPANIQYQKAIPSWFSKSKYNFSWKKNEYNTSWVYSLKKV